MSDTDTPDGHGGLKAWARALRRPLETLHVLTPGNDPYMAAMPSRLELATWFAQLYDGLKIQVGSHVRRIFYLLVSQQNPILLKGKPFENTRECYELLVEAVRDARYLDLIPANVISDRRNPVPTINLPDERDSPAEITTVAGGIETHPFSGSYEAPTLTLPSLTLYDPIVGQRYHLEIWIEKSTANPVLQPLGRKYGINIVTFVGEVSATACEDLVKRAIASGRPVRILHLTDFDPAGRSMPTAAAVKIVFLARKSGVDLDIQLKPLALTLEQCIEYRLPRTPIKASDLRASNFEARFGAGATELDALEALHPGLLHNILVAEIERYIDADLDDNVQDAVREVEDELRRVTSEVQQRHADEIAALDAQREAINRAFEQVHEPAKAAYDRAVALASNAYRDALEQARDEILQMEQSFIDRAELVIAALDAEIEEAAPDAEEFDWPEAAEVDEDDDPLYNSRRSYVEQVDRFRRHQGKNIEVTLSRDRVISKICIECGNPFSTTATNRKVCGSVCLEKRGYRVRKERKRSATNPLNGQKSNI